MFQSERWVVCDKPAGWLSVPARTGAADPRRVLGRALETQIGRRVWPVHRLDVEVSGLILFALDASAHRCANLWFEAHAVTKTYEAWTRTHELPPPAGEQRWQCRLVRGKKRAFEASYGKESLTLAEARERLEYGANSLQRWHLKPLTGRSHQLRFELARHGYPIVGDRLYGSDLAFWPEAIALRAFRLDFSACDAHAALGLPSVIEALSLAAIAPG